MKEITYENFDKLMKDKTIDGSFGCLVETNKDGSYIIGCVLNAYDNKTNEQTRFYLQKKFFYDGKWQEGGVGVALMDDPYDYVAVVFDDFNKQLQNTHYLRKILNDKGLDIWDAPLVKNTQTWSAAFDNNWHSYKSQKERARELAGEWQMWACNECLSYGELAYFADYFTKLGKRYGLLEEFRENGII